MGSIYDTIAKWPKDAAAAFHRHPDRCKTTFPDCSVYEEVDYAARVQHRYKRQDRQMRAYVKAQERAGLRISGKPLYQGGFIIFNQRHPVTSSLQETWLQHIRAAGINDQVSLFFIAQIFAKHIFEFKAAW